jgi:hypothetical protein
MRRHLSRLPLAAFIVAIAISGAGCCPLLVSSDTQSDAGDEASAQPVLEEFLDASKKTGDFELSSQTAAGNSSEFTGQFWVDGRRFRFDLYQGDVLVRSILSPDGEVAYFAQHEEKVCEPSVAGVDHYLIEFERPEGEGADGGIDEETGAQRLVYLVQQTDRIAGSTNPWYTEDIAYLVKDGSVIGVIKRGTVPQDNGSLGEFDTFRRMVSNVRLGADIPADTFELPYPVRDAE